MAPEVFKKWKSGFAIFYTEGEEYYQKFLEMIASAQKTIHLQTYIFESDAFGTKVAEQLIAAAARGVKVYLLVDAVGSSRLGDDSAAEMQLGGVIFARFNKIRLKKWLGLWGRRLHHKILLTDDCAMIGGINVVSHSYMTTQVPQLDFAVLIRGAAHNDLELYCESVFQSAFKRRINFSYRTAAGKPPVGTDLALRISVNDWIARRWQITKRYSNLVSGAKESVLIINSYFFPRRKFMKQLAKAAARGVKVRLILPKYSDWPSYVLATQYLYKYFFDHGIEIYQWKKSILHGKLATIDGSSTTVGSFNLNYTGYQQNLELNVDILSQRFTGEVNLQAEKWIVESCERVSEAEFSGKSPLSLRFKRLFFYSVLSVVAGLSVALTKQGAFSEED